MLKQTSDDYFMKAALEEAKKALERQEVPVGAVVVSNDMIIARAHNLTETLNDPTAHAEMQAITAATNYLGGKYLTECTVYVTVEPCPMCAGSTELEPGLRTWFMAAVTKRKDIPEYRSLLLHPKTKVKKGVLEEECSRIMTSFFGTKRD